MANTLINYASKHVVAESSLLGATYGDGRIVTMQINQDIDNGKLLKKGDYLRPEVYQGATPTASDEVYLVLTPVVIPETFTKGMQDEAYFYNAANDLLRCYPLKKGDIFTVTDNGIKGVPGTSEVGKFVTADGVDIKYSATAPATTNAFAGKIIEKVVKRNRISYRIEVIRNTATA